MPRQFQYSLLQRYIVFGSHVKPATVPINAFGGTSYVHAHIEHNFTDIWWRAIGIPGISNGRGVDLIGVFDISRTWQDAAPVVPGQVWDATGDWYMEAGFAVARIPTFVSDLFFLRFDGMWPIGGLQNRGSFGWSITLSSRFSSPLQTVFCGSTKETMMFEPQKERLGELRERVDQLRRYL